MVSNGSPVGPHGPSAGLLLCVCWYTAAVADPAPVTPKIKPPRLEVPAKWRTEDTPYPPPWARQLPWKGSLQLRFPPGFFQKQDPYFWSYPIFYWLRGDVLADRAALERALRAYDAGLYGRQFKAEQIKMVVGADREFRGDRQTIVYRRVTLHGFDPFVTRRPLTTYLETFRWYCPDSRYTAVLILRSARRPHPHDPVWKRLLRFRASVGCPQTPGTVSGP